jgi:hypothetical protein
MYKTTVKSQKKPRDEKEKEKRKRKIKKKRKSSDTRTRGYSSSQFLNGYVLNENGEQYICVEYFINFFPYIGRGQQKHDAAVPPLPPPSSSFSPFDTIFAVIEFPPREKKLFVTPNSPGKRFFHISQVNLFCKTKSKVKRKSCGYIVNGILCICGRVYNGTAATALLQ